jgi:hypothetical protein
MSGGDGMDSSTRVHVFQVRVGACGYVLSCLGLNGIIIRGPWLSSHSPGSEDLPGCCYWVPGACNAAVRV